MVHSIQR